MTHTTESQGVTRGTRTAHPRRGPQDPRRDDIVIARKERSAGDADAARPAGTSPGELPSIVWRTREDLGMAMLCGLVAEQGEV